MEVLRQQHMTKPVANYETTARFMKKNCPDEDLKTLKIICEDLRDFAINEEYPEGQIDSKSF